jgi:hypothetical protein
VRGPSNNEMRGENRDCIFTVAFVFGLCIVTVGVVGILEPSGLVWIAQHFVTSGAFYIPSSATR